MKHEPRAFLRDSNVLSQFVGTDAVFAIRYQPESAQPLIQSDRRIFEHGSDLDRELLFFVLRLALPNLARGQKENVLRATARAFDNAIRPTNRLQKIERMISLGEILNRFVERLRKRILL